MLNAPVLVLNTERINEINPRNVESLFGMWTVFSRCATTIQEGKRLENMSWRVWARETLCCPPRPERILAPSIDISPTRSSGVPSLSSSIDSEMSNDELKHFSLASRERCRKLSECEDSALSKSRGKEPHLSAHKLQRIVTNIQERSKLEPLSPTIEAVVKAKMQRQPSPVDQEVSSTKSSRKLTQSTESSCLSSTTTDATEITDATRTTTRQSEHRGSETSVSSIDGDGLIRSGSIVHGFSPVNPSSFKSSRARLSSGLSALAATNAAQKALAPAKPGMFTLGGSSEDDEGSFEARLSYRRALPEKRASSLSQNIGKELGKQKKTTSFRDIVEQRRSEEGAVEDDEGAIASSDEDDDDDDDDDIISSAIEEEEEDDDDDDDEDEEDGDEEGEWEDSNSEDGKVAVEEKSVFKRIDSRPNLVSRRSILTQGLTEGDRAAGLLNAATKSQPALGRGRKTSHNGPSMPCSPEEHDEESGIMMQGPSSSKPLPIIPTSSSVYAMAHSPRTTRRKMLSTELTESLRKNLLWERQQKNTDRNFRNRQARSMANLQQAAIDAERVTAAPPLAPNAALRNFSYNFDNPWEYHTKGW